MVNEGQSYLFSAPWASIFPGLAILVTVLAFNFVGDGLRDALDPFLKGRM
jgi:ABC-type dipeptide/oligopeptide/nickel transport system permease subunit